MEGQDKVLATAQQILKSLNTSKDATDDMIAIFSTFDNRLSNINSLMTSQSDAANRAHLRFEESESVILRCNLNSSWDETKDDYIIAVDDVINMIEDLGICDRGGDDVVRDRAESALQLAMSRLEDEFRHILIRNTIPLDVDRLHGSIQRGSLSFASHDGEIVEDLSFEDDDRESSFCHDRGVSLGDVSVDLVAPDAVEELKEIAERMIRVGYERECCQVYSSVRRDVLDECLSILCVEKLSIEEVQKIEWSSLDEKMKKWIHAVKIVIRVLLNREKQLCEEIFDGSDELKESCFLETAKGCVLQLLNFGEAVAIGKRSPEKLFRILDMYDAMLDVLPDLQYLFSYESGEMVCNEAQGVLDGLGEAAIATFVEFEKAVQGESLRKPTQGGEIHPLTRYVMNYVKLLVDYSNTLDVLLQTSVNNSDNGDGDNLQNMSPVGSRLLLLLKCLESNLEEKAKMYEDSAMQYVFLMNNILYIVQKVKDSDLGNLLGDNWIRKNRGKIRQHSTSYLRASWSRVLSCLRDEGIGGSSGNASRVALKERFKNFNACFEEIYRVQTGWKVPDEQLREELRISISENVLPAYRSFLGRFRNQLESGRSAGKYIKYTPEDLENYVSELFEGTPGVMHHLRRKSS